MYDEDPTLEHHVWTWKDKTAGALTAAAAGDLFPGPSPAAVHSAT